MRLLPCLLRRSGTGKLTVRTLRKADYVLLEIFLRPDGFTVSLCSRRLDSLSAIVSYLFPTHLLFTDFSVSISVSFRRLYSLILLLLSNFFIFF
jgi:hypothetical protein